MYDMFYYESVWHVYKNLIVKYCQQNIFDLTCQVVGVKVSCFLFHEVKFNHFDCWTLNKRGQCVGG